MFPAAALSQLLSRASRRPFPATAAEHAALLLCGVDADEQHLPVAPLRYFAELGKAPDGYCLNADPVHLRADTHGLILFDASTLSVTEAEREALTATLAEFFAEQGWRLESASRQHGYLTGQQPEAFITTPLAQVCGKTVDRYLPRGAGAADWLQRGNEIQMLLHAHPVNQQRAASGQPAINSLWLWGGGVLPQRGAAQFDRVYSDNPFVTGLGAWQQAYSAPLPPGLHALLKEARPGDALLVTLDGCRRPLAYGDLEAWNAAVERYERDWFAPALQALSQRRIKQLELVALEGHRYRVAPRDLWRVWRRVKSYRDVLVSGGMQ